MCGARYKTRPGLTYHYNHSHKEGVSDENSRDSNAPTPSTQIGGSISGTFPSLQGGQTAASGQASGSAGPSAGPIAPLPNAGGGMGEGLSSSTSRPDQGQVYQDSYVSFLNQTPGTAIF